MLAGTIINEDLIGVVVTIVIVATIILSCVAVYMGIGAWIMPRMKRLSLGMTARKKQLLCCPPGLGCNDPIPRMNACRREAALRGSTPEEVTKLDAAWAKLNLTPRSKKKKWTEAYEDNPHINTPELALALAEGGHAGDVDKNGEPLILHVKRVGESVAHLGPEYEIVGYLHDLIEDNPSTWGFWEATDHYYGGYPNYEKDQRQVHFLIDRKKEERESYYSSPSSRSWYVISENVYDALIAITKKREGKGMESYLDSYIPRVAANEIATEVKLADHDDNLAEHRVMQMKWRVAKRLVTKYRKSQEILWRAADERKARRQEGIGYVGDREGDAEG